jgi:hypothetical protein
MQFLFIFLPPFFFLFFGSLLCSGLANEVFLRTSNGVLHVIDSVSPNLPCYLVLILSVSMLIEHFYPS